MITLLIAIGALLIALIGCALLEPWPSTLSEDAGQEHERLGCSVQLSHSIAGLSPTRAGALASWSGQRHFSTSRSPAT